MRHCVGAGLAGAPAACGRVGLLSARYLGQQALGQLHPLRIRRHVDDVLPIRPHHPRFASACGQRWRLGSSASRSLGLRGGAREARASSIPEVPSPSNLTAAPVAPGGFCAGAFPSLGRCPTWASLNAATAQQQARKLEARGYDVYVRPVGAYRRSAT